MGTLATVAINWELRASCVDMGSNRLLFAKIRKNAFVAVPESKKALSYAPMLVLNPPSPLVRGGLAKRYAATLLGVKYENIHAEILRQLMKATAMAKKEGEVDRASVVEALLPFDAGLVYENGEPPGMLQPFGVAAWIIEVLQYLELQVGWIDVKDVLQTMLPRSITTATDRPFDEESWVLATTHNIPGGLVELLEHHGIALRQQKRGKKGKYRR